MFLQIKKNIHLPNRMNLARYQRSPELGPKVLFFSGGSALKKACSALVQYTHNSIHIITPFDSGGSSATLREAFQMPAIGDIRNRLMALADKSFQGNLEVVELFNYRFPKHGNQKKMREELASMIKGHHGLVKPIPDPLRKIIRQHLETFDRMKPDNFNLANASIGNLILTAGYLQNRRNFDVIIYIFSSLVKVRGIVRPVVNKCLDLAVELADGQKLVGQHLFSGKEAAPVSSRIEKLELSSSNTECVPTRIPIREKMKQLIRDAELICYPMGSYFSSILATLQPDGIGSAIARNPCPKIMVPNTFDDPETIGMSLNDQIDRLLETLLKDNPGKLVPRDVLNFILLDSDMKTYNKRFTPGRYKKTGIQVVQCPLISKNSSPKIDENHFVETILSFV